MKGDNMEEKKLKRFLAGLCIFGLLGGVSVSAQQSQSG
jgi:radical SAM modification target selenobiotic family peptide